MFKTKFIGWDDVIGVDFTRTAQSVQRTGADLQKWAKQQETKVCGFSQQVFFVENIETFMFVIFRLTCRRCSSLDSLQCRRRRLRGLLRIGTRI